LSHPRSWRPGTTKTKSKSPKAWGRRGKPSHPTSCVTLSLALSLLPNVSILDLMISTSKKYYSIRVLGLAFFILIMMLFSFLFVGSQIIPDKLNSEVSQSCVQHLKDKSYQIKQFLLENVNNSKLWVQNHQSTFFDSRWFAISFYEHDGKEWILKDFKLNNVVVDIYKIAESDYIKLDQSLIAPSASSDQITMKESKVGGLSVLVLDIPNNIPTLKTNHLIRITLFTDLFSSTLGSDENCRLRLMDTKGNFLLSDRSIDESSFLNNIQMGTVESSVAEVFISRFEENDVFNYKILKNLYMFGFAKQKSNEFLGSFIEISVVNFFALGMIIVVFLTVLFQQLHRRLDSINSNITKVSKKNYQLQFDLSIMDEFSDTEEEVSRLADELRKNKK
jgi:hypothetical protein